MLNTEKRNERSKNLDKMPISEALSLINNENTNAIAAVNKAMPAIERICEKMIECIKNGGRIFYVGAGTSGRLGLMDAAECPPTFGVSKDLFNGIMAGGSGSMKSANESGEDDTVAAVNDITAANIKGGDVLIGISASGGAAYVIGAIDYAKKIGAFTAAIVNNPCTPMEAHADITAVLDTGAEVLTGSTRLKAGTAQKIVLNMLSTVTMANCGCVFENMMINLSPTNIKLRGRMIRILKEIIPENDSVCEALLERSGWSLREAINIYKKEF